MRPQWQILDTFDEFLACWDQVRDASLEVQIEGWRDRYMARYAGLLEKQVGDYRAQGVDWRQVARERVFPGLGDSLAAMGEARQNLLATCGPTYERAVAVLGLGFPVVFVIYVGLGCGAGWATRYQGTPACLFGLENIAELGWQDRDTLEAMTAHELGHLTHMAWREEWESFEQAEEDPCFQLYSEGFAQRCEHLILGRDTWHQMGDPDWLGWCQEHKGWLADEFMRRVEEGRPVNEFFGSWFELAGRRQSGYFLGHEFVRWLEAGAALQEIALYCPETVRARAIGFLDLLSRSEFP